MLLKVATYLGTCQQTVKLSNVLKSVFQKKGKGVITSYNVLQHVTKGYKGFRTLVVKDPEKFFPEKWTSCYNLL